MYCLARLAAVLTVLVLSIPAQAGPLNRPGKVSAQGLPIARIDTCANVDQGMLSDGRTDYGTLTGCLCHSTLPRFALLAPAARRATRALGMHTTASLLQSLIGSDASARTCEYPPHALAACSKEDVCGWVCEAGYEACEGRCVPTGECTVPSPSPAPVKLSPETVEQPKPASPALVYPPQHKCAKDYIACPAEPVRSQSQLDKRTFPFPPPLNNPAAALLGSGSSKSRRPAQPDPRFICVDPQTDTQHCGGCSFSASSPTSFRAFTGTDCSNVRGAVSARCEAGRCVVERCKHGWDLNDQGGCTRRYTLSKGQVRLGKVQLP